jgi:glutamate--cysteine ligase
MAVLHAAVADAVDQAKADPANADLASADETSADQAQPLTVDAAFERAQQAALASSVIGCVGLELEAHLVDLDAVSESVAWDKVDPLPAIVGAAAGQSVVSLEPGGQLELSGVPAPDILTSVSQLRLDAVRTRLALAELRLGVAYAGADPLRPPVRVNPRPRYRAMEEHFTATGRAVPGAVMMNSTAAMQVNLQAGPQRGWPERVARAYRLGPTLVAISASSPWLQGHEPGAAWTGGPADRSPAASR